MMKPFVYTDMVFGQHTITEPVIVDLINSHTLQRLTQIDQAGYSRPFFPNLQKHTRFEHSLGVYLLLNRYGASLEEQIAGLIHDVSHAAFSHCVDYALADDEAGKTQSHQDTIFEEYVRASDIPHILAHHGMEVDIILDDRRFPLKEQPLPDLCADRIDYSFRSALAAKARGPDEIQRLLHKLLSNGREWYFSDLSSAREYAELFSQLNAQLWSSFSAAAMFRTVGDCLRYAYQKHYLSYEDFYGTDRTVLEKIENHRHTDAHLQMLFDRMNTIIPFVDDPSAAGPVVFCKSRVVNPLCLHQGRLQRLSDVDTSWTTTLANESRPKSYSILFT